MKGDKPYRILENLNNALKNNNIILDGAVVKSKKGVPSLWVSRNIKNISVCYFMGSKCLKIWTGCGTADNKYYKTVKL